MTNVYEQPRYEGARALAEAIDADDDELLASMIVAAALYEDDFAVVHRACVHLSKHADDQVRGNAVLGFGHIARAFGRLGQGLRPVRVTEDQITRTGRAAARRRSPAGDRPARACAG